jgi:hypothetical protein
MVGRRTLQWLVYQRVQIVDWLNVANCADKRASLITFSFDGETSPLGELETREMARAQAYRQVFVDYFLAQIALTKAP